jgi:hypothetical protein
MRHDQAAGVRYEDIDWESEPLPRLVLRRQAHGGPLKEDKLGVDEIPPEALEPYVRYLGSLVGEVHRRGGAPSKWSSAQQARVLDGAQQLAGLHETAFLQFCDVVFDRFGDA